MTSTAANILDRAALLGHIANLSSKSRVPAELNFQCTSCNAFPFETQEELDAHTCVVATKPASTIRRTVTVAPATEKQVAFLRKLVAERCPDASEEFIQKILAEGKTRVSKAISNLLEKPVVKAPETPQKAAEATVEVPDGHYALEATDGTVRFYTVASPTEGKWAGFTFLSVHASDDRYPIKGAAKAKILSLIAADPRQAALRYGHETRRCGICNKELTDAGSRAAGIGPICANRLGW